MRSLGVCIGASTISYVLLDGGSDSKTAEKDIRIIEAGAHPHNGNPKAGLTSLLNRSPDGVSIAVTGRKFRNLTNLTSIPEPEAIETALPYACGNGALNAVISAGGENFLVYTIGRDRRISSIKTGNKCASGTGEFFLQQIGRLNMGLEEAIGIAREKTPFNVSGRCSVFCKSDCTHATNKGVAKEKVVAGLCVMMAGKILEILKQVPKAGHLY